MHLILTIFSFVQHIIAGKYAGLPTNELRMKLRIDLLNFHSFYDVLWLKTTLLPWMTTFLCFP